MPTIKIGRVRPHFRDAFDPAVAYEAFDAVLFDGSWWLARQDVPAGYRPDSQPDYWALFGARGADGGTAPVSVAEVVTAEPGTPANVENVGTSEDVRLKFTIPRGEAGSQPPISDSLTSPDSGVSASSKAVMLAYQKACEAYEKTVPLSDAVDSDASNVAASSKAVKTVNDAVLAVDEKAEAATLHAEQTAGNLRNLQSNITTTPKAHGIPMADSTGKIAKGWLPDNYGEIPLTTQSFIASTSWTAPATTVYTITGGGGGGGGGGWGTSNYAQRGGTGGTTSVWRSGAAIWSCPGGGGGGLSEGVIYAGGAGGAPGGPHGVAGGQGISGNAPAGTCVFTGNAYCCGGYGGGRHNARNGGGGGGSSFDATGLTVQLTKGTVLDIVIGGGGSGGRAQDGNGNGGPGQSGIVYITYGG